MANFYTDSRETRHLGPNSQLLQACTLEEAGGQSDQQAEDQKNKQMTSIHTAPWIHLKWCKDWKWKCSHLKAKFWYGTQGSVHGRQALYQLTYIPSLRPFLRVQFDDNYYIHLWRSHM